MEYLSGSAPGKNAAGSYSWINKNALGLNGITSGGTVAAPEIGFYAASAVPQAAAIADGTDPTSAQAALNLLLAAMRALGLIAT